MCSMMRQTVRSGFLLPPAFQFDLLITVLQEV